MYRARDLRPGRELAIEVLTTELAQDTAARERLRRKALAAAALDHEYVHKGVRNGAGAAGLGDVQLLALAVDAGFKDLGSGFDRSWFFTRRWVCRSTRRS